jgi:glycosyltransferase involved in cell wall biosynthesis
VPTVPELNPAASEGRHDKLRLIYIGSFIERKGLDLLLNATRLAESKVPVSLDIYGPGAPDDFDLTGGSIRFAGRIPFGLAQQVMTQYDLLVVPSRFDGWGVVVNEAICAGLPIACSSRAGAHMLVDTYDVGFVFDPHAPVALAEKLVDFHQRNDAKSDLQHRLERAKREIQPAVAANVLWNVVSGEPVDLEVPAWSRE